MLRTSLYVLRITLFLFLVRWQTMDNTAWKVSAAKLDGVLFRTEQHENRKKCKRAHCSGDSVFDVITMHEDIKL